MFEIRVEFDGVIVLFVNGVYVTDVGQLSSDAAYWSGSETEQQMYRDSKLAEVFRTILNRVDRLASIC